ncbi:hypothetical protein BASA60_010456 [Batrachochytrium salamandrivorans]|nr:hypothetical protein BASA60_010456 [Batrachochytrium salamandrivorans]
MTVLGSVSIVLSSLVLYTALLKRHGSVFGACVHLAQSSGSLLILSTTALYSTFLVGQTLQTLFFGNLRAIEVEHLYERCWSSIMDTCIAMTIFRYEFEWRFVVFFVFLLFVKVFHWICADKVDYMEQSTHIPLSFHIRTIAAMSLLLLVDISFIGYAVSSIITHGPTMMILFAFEYSIMLVVICSIFTKYILHSIDLQNETPWEEKSIYFFYVELTVDFLKLLGYSVFFLTIMHYYSIPLHIVRDLYMTLRSFIRRCGDLIKYHRATANMDQRYPNATATELATMDRVCIICREEMVAVPGNAPPAEAVGIAARAAAAVGAVGVGGVANRINPNTPKRLPCGHVFHFRCLRSWLERQQACPTCRRSVMDIPAQAPVQPAAVNPVAAVNPIAANANDNVPQPAGAVHPHQYPQAPPAAMYPGGHNPVPENLPVYGVPGYLDQFQHLGAPPVQMEFPGGHGMAQAPIYLTPLGPAPSSMLMPQNLIPMTPLESLTDAELCAMEGTSRNAIIQRLEAIGRIQAQLAGITAQFNQILHMLPTETPVDESHNTNE